MSVNQQQPLAYEDEINLADIFRVLFRKKRFILITTAASVCIGLLYALSLNKVYEAQTLLLPPSAENIQTLNPSLGNLIGSIKANNDRYYMAPHSVFDGFIRNINSTQLRQEFLDKYNILRAQSESTSAIEPEKLMYADISELSDSLEVNLNAKNGGSISLVGGDEGKTGFFLDGLVELSAQKTKKQLVRNLQVHLKSKIQHLKVAIAAKRAVYKQRREDELEHLREAYQIAKSLNIVEYLLLPKIRGNTKNTPSKELNRPEKLIEKMETKNLSSYMRGTKVLQAEINAITNRKNEDFKIVGLRNLQERLARLESITIEEDMLQTVIVDKKAIVDVERIGPKRKLIVLSSLILGLVLGVLSVFILGFISNFKKEINS